MARPRHINTLEVTVCRSGPNNPADEAIAATPEGEAPDFVALGEKRQKRCSIDPGGGVA